MTKVTANGIRYGGVQLVFLTSASCGSCRAVRPTCEEAGCLEMDTDLEENQAFLFQHAMQSVPTVVVFQEGEKVDWFIGKNITAENLKIAKERFH